MPEETMARVQNSRKVFCYQIYIQVTNAVNRIQTKGDSQDNSTWTENLVLHAVLVSEIPRETVLNVSIVFKRLNLQYKVVTFRTGAVSALLEFLWR